MHVVVMILYISHKQTGVACNRGTFRGVANSGLEKERKKSRSKWLKTASLTAQEFEDMVIYFQSLMASASSLLMHHKQR
jgi:hypothetical protein